MSFFESVFLGFIQGITEFLPVSSSGHLWLAQYFLQMEEAGLAIEIVLHFATLLAVIVYFWKDIWSLLQNFFSPNGDREEKQLSWKLLVATAITGVIGIATKDYFAEEITASIVGITLIITAGLILVSEYFPRWKNLSAQNFTWTVAVFLGLVQAIALFPGISRSGITIAFLLLLGIAKTQSVRISFLLSIPTILGASLLLLHDISSITLHIIPVLIAGITAFSFALLTIWGMMKHLDKIWKWCALWCFGLGVMVLFL